MVSSTYVTKPILLHTPYQRPCKHEFYEPNQDCGKVKLSISNLLLVNKTHMNQWINQMNQSMKDQDVFRALRTQCIIIKYELRFIIGFLKFTLRKIKLRNLPFQIDGLQCMKQVVEDSNAFFPPFLKRMNCQMSMLFFINVMSLLRLYLGLTESFLKKR